MYECICRVGTLDRLSTESQLRVEYIGGAAFLQKVYFSRLMQGYAYVRLKMLAACT